MEQDHILIETKDYKVAVPVSSVTSENGLILAQQITQQMESRVVHQASYQHQLIGQAQKAKRRQWMVDVGIFLSFLGVGTVIIMHVLAPLVAIWNHPGPSYQPQGSVEVTRNV